MHQTSKQQEPSIYKFEKPEQADQDLYQETILGAKYFFRSLIIITCLVLWGYEITFSDDLKCVTLESNSQIFSYTHNNML